MTREELIKMVALKMDEISSSNDVIVQVLESDNNPLYAQIDGLLNESINDVLMKAPIYRLHNHIVSSLVSKAATKNGIKVAIIDVPEEFLRLVSIVDNAFQRPIVELAVEGDDIDKRQHNKFLVAKQAKPVAVISNSAATGRIITCYSYSNNAQPSPVLNYIKRCDDESSLDEYQIDIVTWVCAGKVFAIQGDTVKGKMCDDNAVALMS